ncbi:MAG TPA: rRNA maturation RNase YbeY [Gemmatimonadales bacterium]|nr:rRNA maturation RNase YbeY [Gemmatimonadales bacterium]
MAAQGCVVPLSRPAVRRVVAAVLRGERRRVRLVSVTFLSPSRMRRLNRQSLGSNAVTDVIAFGLAHRRRYLADLYLCPAYARASARAARVAWREELVRVLVHGLLHALGYDHPAGTGRTTSRMWRRQERYVARLTRRTP